jgi:arylsulfatase A-like enzyme
MHGGCGIGLRTPERKPIAERLGDAGYWTAGFTSNPTCGISGGFHRGFGTFKDLSGNPPDLSAEAYPHRADWRRLAKMGIPPSAVEKLVDSAELTGLALDWLTRRNSDAPWFLWMHYSDSHWPYRTPDAASTGEELFELWQDREFFRNEIHPSRGKCTAGERSRNRWMERYRQALGITDLEIGRLLDAVRLRPDWNRTIVAVAGDHGEEFHEHGTWQHQWNRLYREGIHIPVIVRVPGAAPGTVAQPVGQVDLAPTFLDYAGLNQPGDMVGASLRPLVNGQKRPATPVLTEMMAFPNGSSYLLAIRGEWKYMYDFDNRQDSGLFRVSEDPDERENLRERCPGVFRRFEQMRLGHVSQGLIRLLDRNCLSQTEENAGGVVEEQLAALGYI